MSLDDKFKEWKEATEQLTPSPGLHERLEALAESSASAAGASGAWKPVFKVLVSVVAVGAVVFAVLKQRATVADSLDHQWSTVARIQGSGPSRANDGGATTVPCGERPSLPPAGNPHPALVAYKSPSDDEVRAARIAIEKRPLTCEEQGWPLRLLLQSQLRWDEELRVRTRYLVLCPTTDSWVSLPSARAGAAGGLPGVPGGVGQSEGEPCDSSDWCHDPQCDLSTDECQWAFALRPIRTCGRAYALRSLLGSRCMRYLKDALSSDDLKRQVRDLSDRLRLETGEAIPQAAWCLEPEAQREIQHLRKRAPRAFRP
jgi:hypothetical protein